MIPIPTPAQDHLTCVIQSVANDLLTLVDPIVPPQDGPVQVNVRSLKRSYIHCVGVVEVPGTNVRCFAKARKPRYVGQDLRNEAKFLSSIAPEITSQNPLLRTPAMIAYYGDHDLLLMEFIAGRSLKQHLFDFRPSNTANISKAVELSGEWLARLHCLTRQDATINPLESLLHSFEKDYVQKIFERCSLDDCHSQIVALLHEYLRLNPGFQRHQCTTHGEFTPLHVLVSGAGICVVDFGSSRPGLPHDDIALFTGFWDSLLPWRMGAGKVRLRFADPKKLFLDSYFKHAGWNLTAADALLMRFTRIKALIRLLASWDQKMNALPGVLHSSFWNLWFLPRFAAACRRELDLLSSHPATVLEQQIDSQQEVPAERSA